MIRELMCASALSADGGSSRAASQTLHNPDCGRFVVSNGDELADAVAAGATHIIVKANGNGNGGGGGTSSSNQPTTIYLPCHVTVSGDHILLVESFDTCAFSVPPPKEPNDDDQASKNDEDDEATSSAHLLRPSVRIVGNWKIEQRARMNAHDIEFSGDGDDTQSLFFLSTSASLMLHDCVLRDAREAVYLSSSTQAVLTECKIINNVRGIFESFRSSCRIVACEFQSNIFHAVLLSSSSSSSTSAGSSGKDKLEAILSLGNCFMHSPAGETTPAPAAATNSSNRKSLVKVCRGDVCFKYNPMLDRYDDVFLKGVKCVLTESEASTGLVDESFGQWG